MDTNRATSGRGRRKQTAAGFTLVELLVVMAISGLLMSMLLPAVLAARGAARKADASHRLRQIGLAIANHATLRRHFPAGYLANAKHPQRDPTTWDGPPGWGWGAQLLPFLDEQVVSDRLNWQLPVWHPSNAAAVTAHLPAFLNPSAPRYDRLVEVRGRQGERLAVLGRSSFVANAGHDEPWAYTVADHTSIANGVFFRNSRLRPRDISDGLSKTVFIGEHAVISDKTWVGVVPGAEVCPVEPERFPFTSCDEAATLMLVHSGPAASEPGVIHPPNFPTCHVCQMYSPHTDGAFVLLGDGSVTFVSPMINVDVWAAMCSRNGGEVLTDAG